MYIEAKMYKIFRICIYLQLLATFLDFFTTLFFFSKIPGFSEYNVFHRIPHIPLHLTILPVIFLYLLIAFLFYYINVETENRIVEGITLGYLFTVTYIPFYAIIHNYLILVLNIPFPIEYFISIIISILITSLNPIFLWKLGLLKIGYGTGRLDK